MPIRLLRDGILDSDAVCSLSFPAEIFYRRLMSVVDDFGRFDGRLSVLRCRLYALQIDKVREADIPRWIAECEKAGLIVLYHVESKPYILFHKLGSPRAKDSKFPPPPGAIAGIGAHPPPDESNGKHLQADESNGKHLQASAPYSGSSSYSGSSTSAPPESDGKKAKKPTKEKPPPKTRERNPLFDAIAEVSGLDPTTAGGLIGKVAATLAEAEPPFGPDDVRLFARRFWELLPYAARDKRPRPTPNEIEKYIGLIRAQPPAPAPQRIYDTID